jgi:hypothetical protein
MRALAESMRQTGTRKWGRKSKSWSACLLGGWNAVLRRGLMFETVFSLRIRQI